jgi:hypothetical protein
MEGKTRRQTTEHQMVSNIRAYENKKVKDRAENSKQQCMKQQHIAWNNSKLTREHQKVKSILYNNKKVNQRAPDSKHETTSSSLTAEYRQVSK